MARGRQSLAARYSFRTSTGSLAIFAAIRRTLSRVRSCVYARARSSKSHENYCTGNNEG
jgi:hypothetical protein